MVIPLSEPIAGTSVSSVIVPKGTILAIPVNVMQMDPEIYGPDAHIFRPHRWLETSAPKSRDLFAFSEGCVKVDLHCDRWTLIIIHTQPEVLHRTSVRHVRNQGLSFMHDISSDNDGHIPSRSSSLLCFDSLRLNARTKLKRSRALLFDQGSRAKVPALFHFSYVDLMHRVLVGSAETNASKIRHPPPPPPSHHMHRDDCDLFGHSIMAVPSST